jgi:two-component system response regulator FixJ
MPGKRPLYGAVNNATYREHAEATQRLAVLSPRERQVLEAMVHGYPNKVIAYNLGIAVRTVEVHRAHMLERLGLRSTAEAIRLAVLATMKWEKNGAEGD